MPKQPSMRGSRLRQKAKVQHRFTLMRSGGQHVSWSNYRTTACIARRRRNTGGHDHCLSESRAHVGPIRPTSPGVRPIWFVPVAQGPESGHRSNIGSIRGYVGRLIPESPPALSMSTRGWPAQGSPSSRRRPRSAQLRSIWWAFQIDHYRVGQVGSARS